MLITWIGQAGLLLEKENLKILIDPYLSDSVGALNPEKHRRVPIREELFQIRPNIMIFTHDHLDHFDPETAEKFLHKDSSVTILAPRSVWQKIRKYPGKHNPVLISPGTTWTECGIRFTAVKAEHSDPYAIGIIVDDGNKKYYITGDTLYNKAIFSQLPTDIHAVFLPVNGVGNNMNMTDAAAFAHRIGAKITVPIHYGMFDNIQIENFDVKNKQILKLYQEETL